MIHQTLANRLQAAELQKALDAIEEARPRIERLQAQGEWVAITVVVSAPASVDLLRNVFTEQSQIVRFSHIMVTYGSTREQAINPPARLEAAPANTRPLRSAPDPGPNRRFQSALAEVRPPFRRQEATQPSLATLRLRTPDIGARYARLLTALRTGRSVRRDPWTSSPTSCHTTPAFHRSARTSAP